MSVAIYCADIGSVPNGRFGWARADPDDAAIERHRGGSEIIDLVDAVAEDLAAERQVALGFDCPLFVPVPEQGTRPRRSASRKVSNARCSSFSGGGGTGGTNSG